MQQRAHGRKEAVAVPIRVYADTSVYGGVFDAEFERASRLFFDQVRQGRFRLVGSALVALEIVPAPQQVRDFYASIESLAEAVPVTGKAIDLQRAYLAAGIVSDRSEDDALHVALATTGGCAILVSWNFKHIVHVEKSPRYNAVNVLRGDPLVEIHSPPEVVAYEQGI
jgi:predicted nucleic acid-binding protein